MGEVALFAYRTTIHHSTGVSPFEMMYGRKPCKDTLPSLTGYEVQDYQTMLKDKLAELRDFVEVEITKAAESQRVEYNKHMTKREFHQGDLVWLSIPTAGKCTLGRKTDSYITQITSYSGDNRWCKNKGSSCE